MSVAHLNLIGHVAKRGIAAAQDHFTQTPPEMMSQLQQDADKSLVSMVEFLPVVVTGVITLLLIASIRYTVGDVMASLAMIESPSSTAIIEPKKGEAPPPYSDEPDAPLEKEALMTQDNDVEITVINHKPITAGIKTTIGHLHRTGGFFSRWRGAGVSVLYHFVHALMSNSISAFLELGIFGSALAYIFTSIATCRLHALWTHSMIAKSSKPWYRRFVPRKSGKALLLPSLVFAAAQQATFMLPLSVAYVLNVHGMHEELPSHVNGKEMDCGKAAIMALRVLAVPATALIVALAVYLPASVTLVRIEAALLSEEEQTIVPFDRETIMENVDLSVRGGAKTLFVQAWRSFDRSARLRLIKIYIKMVFAQFFVGVVGLHLAMAELYLIGPERLVQSAKSTIATFQLMAIEAQQNAQNVADVQIN